MIKNWQKSIYVDENDNVQFIKTAIIGGKIGVNLMIKKLFYLYDYITAKFPEITAYSIDNDGIFIKVDHRFGFSLNQLKSYADQNPWGYKCKISMFALYKTDDENEPWVTEIIR